ncbi:DUF6988 family protein [Piscinibacter sakaiensis]|uniref:DUF6988 family protein n=1 Tax=Piscinibacter sakaiensis TaxID=1547922 RepID=UPI003AABB5CA
MIAKEVSSAIALSDRVHSRLLEAFEEAMEDSPDEMDIRDGLTLDACNLALDHAEALRTLLELGLNASGLAMLRLQYEALLRATWVFYAAKDGEVAMLAAPLTTGTSDSAKKLPMANELLSAVERSEAPAPLRLGLREFRTTAWDAMNSYVHGGIHPLRRSGSGHPVEELTTAIQSSNAMSYSSLMLAAATVGCIELIGNINVIVTSHPGFARSIQRR